MITSTKTNKNPMKRHEHKNLPFGLRLAKKVALRSTHKIQIGATYLAKGRIVTAWNMCRTSPAAIRDGYRWDQSHAEWNLFQHTKDPTIKYNGTVYVYRSLADGTPGLARPCPTCLNYLKRLNISVIIYTTYKGYTKEWLNNGRKREFFI